MEVNFDFFLSAFLPFIPLFIFLTGIIILCFILKSPLDNSYGETAKDDVRGEVPINQKSIFWPFWPIWPDVTTKEGRNSAYNFAHIVVYVSLILAILSFISRFPFFIYNPNPASNKTIRAVLSLAPVICFGITAYGIKHKNTKATAVGLIYAIASLIIPFINYLTYRHGAIHTYIFSLGIISWTIILIKFLGLINGVRAVDAHNKAITPAPTTE